LEVRRKSSGHDQAQLLLGKEQDDKIAGCMDSVGCTSRVCRFGTDSGARRVAEVLRDHRVVFRLRAPQARAVTIADDFWLKEGRSEKLVKDAQGMWSSTTEPLPGAARPNFQAASLGVA
jgi:hypothetical protein